MKIGIDLVQISDFQARLGEAGGLDKVLMDSEREHPKSLESLAWIFAVKEAFLKLSAKGEISLRFGLKRINGENRF